MPSNEFPLSLAVIADCHLPIETDHPVFRRFLDELATIHGAADIVVLLGDVFQVWAPGTVFDHENGKTLVARIQDLPRRTVLVEGNWDFFLEKRLSGVVEAHETVLHLTLADTLQVALTHGHMDTGWKDRVWMHLLKSAPSRRWFSTRTVGAWLGRKLNDTFMTGEFSKSLSDDALIRMFRRLARRFPSTHRIICGHVHRAVRWDPVVSAPDYYSTHAFLGLDRNGTPGLYRIQDDAVTQTPSPGWYRLPSL